MIPTLLSEKVTLTPFQLLDAPLVRQYAGHQEIARTTQNIPHPYLEGVAEKWIASHLLEYLEKRNVILAVRTLSGGLAGSINLNLAMDDQRGELGYWIAVPFWGRGLGTDAARRIIRYGFEELGLNKIYARHLGGNLASGRVMQKAGMKLEGVQRQHTLKDGDFVDIVEYGILKPQSRTLT